MYVIKAYDKPNYVMSEFKEDLKKELTIWKDCLKSIESMVI